MLAFAYATWVTTDEHRIVLAIVLFLAGMGLIGPFYGTYG